MENKKNLFSYQSIDRQVLKKERWHKSDRNKYPDWKKERKKEDKYEIIISIIYPGYLQNLR